MPSSTFSDPPVLSVLMPSFNHETFVVEAVQSVLCCQTVPLELVIIDDGSTDKTVERVKAIHDPRIILLTQENQGAHVAFNRALDAARGELIALINSDDVFTPGKIERLTDALRQGDFVAVASWLQLIDPQGGSLGIKHGWQDMPPWPPPTRGSRLAELAEPRLALLESNWIATTSNIAFKRDAATDLRFRSLRYCHDWDFFLGLAKQGPLKVLEETTVRYRIHPKNTLREGQAQGQAQMWLEILWVLVAHGQPLIRALGRQDDLATRFWAGLPRFGGTAMLTQLFALRGSEDQPSNEFLQLLNIDNALRKALINHLERRHDGSPDGGSR